LFRKILTNGTFIEKQSVIQSLATLSNEPALIILNELADQLLTGELDPKIQLDLVEALEQQEGNEEIIGKLSTYQSKKDASDPIVAYRETLEGGHVNRGRNIFYRNQAAQCVRCHAVFEYGGNAGPGLAGVADRLTKEEMLISLVEPSAMYSPGYGVVILETKDGGNISGIVMKETDTSIELQIGKEDLKTIQKSEITSRENIPSSMPSMKEILTKREIRDVVAFLATLQEEE
jgi:putative heme-binding domain-containing protein